MSETDDDPREQLAVGAALVAMGLLAVALLALGVSWWWIAFPIGGGLVPLARGLAMRETGENGTDDEPADRQDALDALRSRYARGELTDAEFEARLERLLETESVEGARDAVERRRTRERERDVE